MTPTSGTVTVLGTDVLTHPLEARHKIGVVFQAPALDKKLSVRENLRHAGHLQGLSGPTLETKITQLLDRFGVADRDGDRSLAVGRVHQRPQGGRIVGGFDDPELGAKLREKRHRPGAQQGGPDNVGRFRFGRTTVKVLIDVLLDHGDSRSALREHPLKALAPCLQLPGKRELRASRHPLTGARGQFF